MKVVELLESEFENVPSKTNVHLKNLRKKRASLSHRQEVIKHKLSQLFPDDDFGEVFNSWRINQLDAHNFPEKSRPFIQMLKKINVESEKLQKEEVAAKINMRYAKHDPEMALRHAMGVRKGQYREGEDAIASNGKVAFEYATTVIHHRFEKGEPAMSRDCDGIQKISIGNYLESNYEVQ